MCSTDAIAALLPDFPPAPGRYTLLPAAAITAAHCNQYQHAHACKGRSDPSLQSHAAAGMPQETTRRIIEADAHIDLQEGYKHPYIGRSGDWKTLNMLSVAHFGKDPALPTQKSDVPIYERALKKGFKVQSADGHSISFTEAVLEHWETADKTPDDIAGRLKHLPDAIRTIRAPHEIWELPNKQRAYIRAFIDQKKSAYISGFVVGASGEVRSYVYTHRPIAIDSARKGKLLYKRA